MTRSKYLAVSALALSMAALPSLAAAQVRQPDTQDASDLGEIIVTAQKREQALIEVPQSITVVGGETLERQQATSFQDYLKLVPGLQLDQSTPGQGRLVLRGVNTGGVASTVAVYVDETPFGSSSGLVNGSVLAGDFDTFDIARIEVLRGPQGTLYGASSLGGVLKFVTNAPSTTGFEARARTSVETVEDGETGYSGAAMVNLPLSDTLAIRGSGYYRELGGFIDSIGTAGSDLDQDINGSRSYGGRVSLLYRPNDRFSARFNATAQTLDADASSEVESDADTLETLYGQFSRAQFVPTFTTSDYTLFNATLDYDLGFATLTSSTSLNALDQSFQDDLTPAFSAVLVNAGFPDNEFLQNQDTNYDKMTQEFRLSSNEGAAFEWLVGAYYTREEGEILQDLVAVTPGTLTPIAGLPVLGNVQLTSDYEEYAVFANATVALTDRFEVTFGGRYSDNEQSARQVNDGILAGGAATFPTAGSSEDVFTYSIAPRFAFSPQASLYARVARGFRPGGPNVLPPGAPANAPRTYESDALTSYEVGFKGAFADGAVTLDVAAFHLDWEDIQLFATSEGFGFNANGGSATINGLEFTLATTPLEGLSLSLNGALTDTELEGDTDPFVGGLDGDRLPYTPEVSLSLNADYEWSVLSDATAYVGASVRALSKQTGDYDFAFRTANGRQRELEAYEVIDLRAGIDFGRVSLEAFAKNVGDSEGRTSTGGLGFFPNGALGTGVIRPRTVGLALTASF